MTSHLILDTMWGMERKLARIETVLSLDPIPGADKIEVATIGGWKVVVKKGTFIVGQLAVFFEIDSLLPFKPWNAFLFKDKREVYRLRTIKLRGQLSQGLLIPIFEIPELAVPLGTGLLSEWVEGDDVTGLLSVTKWEPNIPGNLAGQVKGSFPHFLRKTDEERLQNARDVLDEIQSIDICIAQKLDGTSATFYRHEGVFGVCSRNLELREEGGDDYWAIAKALDLPTKLPEGYAIQGELVGPGIQGNKLGLAQKDLYVFNVWDIKEQRYLDWDAGRVFAERILGIKHVPLVWYGLGAFAGKAESLMTGSMNVADWLAFADTVKYPNGAQAEGIVIRAARETYSPALRGRLSFKVISNAFLISTGE